MAWKCDVCGKGIHLKKINNKNYPIRCPYEKFKRVKNFYTPEFKQMMTYTFFGEFPLSNDPQSLIQFSEYIPEETPILKYTSKIENDLEDDFNLYTKTLILQSSLETFFTHFTRFLIHTYDNNKVHFVDSNVRPDKNQFNYVWLSPTTLREVYFGESSKEARYKSMTDLSYQSLVVYPIGNVSSVKHGAWGDILLDLITNRQTHGKPTWIVKSKDFNSCPEVTSSEGLRNFLTRSSKIPTVVLDPDEELIIGSTFYDYSNSGSSSSGVTGGGSYDL